MRILVVLLLSVFILAGCSAAGLKKAEENTRLAGAVNPLGAIIHLPIWVAATVANVGSNSSSDDEPSDDRPNEPNNQKGEAN